jgi:hypothetical protein
MKEKELFNNETKADSFQHILVRQDYMILPMSMMPVVLVCW